MATAFQNHANYANLPYTISPDQNDTALILTFKNSGDAALRQLEKWGDPASNLSVVQNGELANSSSEHHFNFLAKDETLELTYNIQVADDSAAINESPIDTSTVVVTITGTNDKPDITIVDVTGAVTEDQDTITSNGIEVLRDSGRIDFSDIDITDRSNAAAELVSVIDDLGDDSPL